VLVYVLPRDDQPTRFGFIVGKGVGSAVRRNLVRRRLRAISRELLVDRPQGSDIVMRALSGSDGVDWTTLRDEIAEAVHRSVTK
jgi:ribonuclease P protein component